MYIQEFEEARLEYNDKQVRDDRKINNYFSNISNNDKNDLACEIIIELGDKDYWDKKDKEFKIKMVNVYTKQVEDFELLLPNFKVASAIIHFDETSPHMHIVGVPIKDKNKNGMAKQVGKSTVFTKESLKSLQDKMRQFCIESFNNVYNLNSTLKTKKKGRNRDYNISEMDSYAITKKEIEKHKDKLSEINTKSSSLENDSKMIKGIIKTLKNTPFNKDNHILNQKDKKLLINYINNVINTNKEYKKVNDLSVSLNNIDNKLKENVDTITTLTENNEALNLRINTLNTKVESLTTENNSLKEENNHIKGKLLDLKDKFDRLLKYIKNKLCGKKDQDIYYDFSKDLYTHRIINEETFMTLKDKYDYSKKTNIKNEYDR